MAVLAEEKFFVSLRIVANSFSTSNLTLIFNCWSVGELLLAITLKRIASSGILIFEVLIFPINKYSKDQINIIYNDFKKTISY
jgi:hypothetical protein